MANTRNIWQFRGSEGFKPAPELTEATQGSPLLATLLHQRGINTPEAAREFLNFEAYKATSGLELPDMDKAITRICKALEAKENILIYGDFDVDGITGTSILLETFRFLGANVSYYIPDRAKEGHGLNSAAAIRLASTRKAKLVITTDTGITDFNEVSLLKGLGVDTIVTDHHELPENLPPSIANVNPRLLKDPTHPLWVLCGAGVAYKLSEVLLDKVSTDKKLSAKFLESLLDLVAIGTVADLASLLKDNRHLVWQGLKVLNKRQRLGVKEILAQAGTNPEAVLTSETVGFTIGPRLNALGRLDNATEAVEYITARDVEKAKNIAAHLEHLNRKRRDLCDKIFIEAEQHLNAAGGIANQRVIIMGSAGWHLGIIGIVASRLIEKYHVPVMLMVIDEEKQLARCSARSIPSFNFHEHMTPLNHYFEEFGGHAAAGGFKIKLEKLDAFKKEVIELTNRVVTDEAMRPIINIDAKLQWSQINPHLIELLNTMAPFGMDNPSPKFVVESVNIGAQKQLGEDGRHMKFILTNKGDKNHIEALYWNFGARQKLDTAGKYSFVAVPEINTFNGSSKVQLIVEDFQSSEKVKTEVKAQNTVIPIAQTASAALLAQGDNNDNNGPRWIDHRSRDNVEAFVGQLMLPLQDKKSVAIFHEGRAPEIPFLDKNLLFDRSAIQKVDELIFWDLPPALEVLQQVLATAQPNVIHFVGGKYQQGTQQVPVFPSEQQYLKAILQTVNKQLANKPEWAVAPDTLAAQLATTPQVALNGLTLLSKAGFIQTRFTDTQGVVMSKGETTPAGDLTQHIEFLAYKEALRGVGQFRHWLLTTPLDTIRALYQAPAAYATPSRQEPEKALIS